MGIVYPSAWAQSDADALRYSTTNILGSSARSMGVGGAIGALGADPSVVLINPASLAQYKNGAFNFSVGMNNFKSKTNYLNGDPLNSNRYKAEIPSLNFVFTERKMIKGEPAKTGWINYNFGMGINKTADYSRRISYAGTNTKNSMLDFVSDYVQGLPSSQLDANDEQLSEGFYYFENMFWYGYLIDTIQDGQYAPTYDRNNPNQYQSGSITSKGGMNEINLSFAANYSHKVYFGFGVNIHQLHYDEINTFSESDNPLTTGTWNSFDFTRNLETRGLGYSGRLGVVFRPNDAIRLGLSMKTPTVLSLTDYYYDELYVNYDDGSVEDMRTIDKEYSYNVVSPTRYGLQAAYIFGKSGFISAELESVDYSTMNIYSDDYDFVGENQQISNKYQNAVNLKVGGEYAMNEFRLRAGYAQMGTPFSTKSNYDQKFITFGMGMQEKTWGFDLAVVNSLGKSEYVPYNVAGFEPAVASISSKNTQIVLTLSTKF